MSEQKSSALSLKDIVEGKNFRVPLYQRNYKWNKEQAEKLVADLIDACNNKATKSIGLITLYKNEDKYDVIDGQQRLITLSILLNILNSNYSIALTFQRDDNNKIRENALKGSMDYTTDTDRISRNREAIKNVLNDNKLDESKFNEFADYVLNNCMMLCNITENQPVDEFMNLNAYKTAFSISDYVRSHLIMLNTLHYDKLKENISDISAGLSESTYKSAIAELYNRVLDILYNETDKNGEFSSPYKVLVNKKRCKDIIDADDTKESRINVLFENKNKKNYRFEPESTNFDDLKKLLIKLLHICHLLERLEQDMSKGDFSTAKAIDNYEKINKKSFLSLLFNLNKEDEKLSLSELLNKYSNINTVLIKQLDSRDLRLANRYFEAYVYDKENKATNNEAETDNCQTPHMSDNEIIASISGTGRYVLDRFLTEQHYQIDSFVKIPPVLDLTDKENNNFGGTLEVENDSITVRNLFENKIKIPVIQRDYCMGMQINENNKENFLKYLINNFNNNSNKTLNVSTILVSKEIDSKIVYIFDGQQRTYTIYQILKHLGKELKSFEFIGRGQREHGSRYSEKSVENLQKHLDEVLKNYDEQKKAEFADFLWNNVTFTVKQLVEVSSAEQFFMDINGGVPLEPYEIYKSCLYNRLKSIDEEFVMEFMKLVENNWLNSIYNLLDIKEDDESDKEEITEIRLIEYLCRYFYKRKTEKTAVGFDELESKNMVVEKTRAYLNELNKEDFEYIKNFMESFFSSLNSDYKYIAHIPGIDNDKHKHYFEYIYTHDHNSYKCHICLVQLNKNITEQKQLENIIKLFVSSFSPEKRKKLLKFYSCKDKWLIRNIYDKDELVEFSIKYILSEPHPNSIYDIKSINNEIADVDFIGGYNPGKIHSFKIYEKEIPAYYADINFVEENSHYFIVRPNHLYEQNSSKVKGKKKILFFLTNDSGTIKQPDGSYTMFLLSKFSDYGKLKFSRYGDEYHICIDKQDIKLTNRTDSGRLKNKDTRNALTY